MSMLRIILPVLFSVVISLSSWAAKDRPAPSLEVHGKSRIAIPKSGLGKEYMLSTSIIPQAGAPTSTGMTGRVVVFEQFEDGVDMYESTRGQVVTEDLPARRLMATFPVVDDSGGELVIDFNQGMRRLIYQGWYSMAPWFSVENLERAAELPQARVFEVSSEDGILAIRQAVQMRSRAFDQDLEARYEVRYFISPYANGDFEGKEMTQESSRYTKFFTVPGVLELETGRVSQKVSRFDLSEPIVFYYSANTPEDMKVAVRDGILYWNKAFGKKVVEAREAPADVSAPDPNLNVVQWVPWDSAGFAYADLLLDPLTGKALRGQAYLTSVFDILGKARARRILRSLQAMEVAEEEGGDEGDDGHGSLLWKAGFAGCRVDPREFALELSKGLEQLLADPDLTDKKVVEVARNYVREVTAHEVGHVLGLRHNFAGNLDDAMSPAELDQFLVDFIADADLSKYGDKRVSTSMMEYSVFKAGVFIGWQIATSEKALAHDEAAIRWGYFDDQKVIEEQQLFASDEDTFTYGDVRRFDYGKDPVLAEYSDLSDAVRYLPNSVVERFIQARAPQDPRDRQSLESVPLNASDFARRLSVPVDNVLDWFRKDTRSLKVENEFSSIDDINEEARREAHWKYLNTQLEALGGVDRVIFAHLPIELSLDTKEKPQGVEIAPRIDAEALGKRLKELLESPAYATFVGLDDETYTWTEDEKKIIVERGVQLFGKLEEETLLQTLTVFEDAPRDLGLAAVGHLSDEDCVAQLEKRVIDLAKTVIIKRSEDVRIKGKVDKAFVEVPEFEYGFETRLAAAKALNDETGSFIAWSKDAKQQIHEELKKAVEESLNIGHFKEFDDKLLSRSLREWYQKELELLKLLPPDPKKKAEGGKGGDAS